MTEKKCSKCGALFGCNADSNGCWCENYSIDTNTLQQLKKDFENCLCEDCLKQYASTKAIDKSF